MSDEQRVAEAGRWLSQGRSDIAAARDSLAAGRCEWACFQAQQAAEKAMKACWFHLDLDPWGHSVVRLVDGLPAIRVGSRFTELRELALLLDKLYIPTRYPNGLPGITPAEAYTAREAGEAIASAESIIGTVEVFMAETPS